MNSVRVSVLTPVYNRAGYVRAAIESALRQTGAPLEAILVDDGSTDGSADVVRAVKDPRVRCFRNATNCGPAAARNLGLREARGEWILALDSDDRLPDGALEAHLRALERFPDADVFYGNLRLIDAHDADCGTRDYRAYGNAELLPAFLYGCVVPYVGSLIRAERMRAIGGFDERLTGTEDYDLMARLASGGRFRHSGQYIYAYRQHGDQLRGHANRGDPEMVGRVLDGMLARHALRDLFPDCFAVAASRDLAARVRLAAVFDHHGLSGRRDAALADVVARLCRPDPPGAAADRRLEARELAGLIWRFRKMPDRPRARRLANAAIRRYPRYPELWKEWLLAFR